MIKPVRYRLMLLLAVLSAPGQADERTHEFRLDNGLKLIVREDHRAPVVVSQIWYRIGSSYEYPGMTGLSHMLEHMMFKGSRKMEPGGASRLLRELGVEENAFTGDDYTAYYQVMARDRLPVAFELEADRMQTLTLPADEFRQELEVVKEERRLRTDDQPSALAYERFKTLAFPSSSYRNPTVGWMRDLQRMTVEDARHWYQTWYAPNNATLVVVGDVRPDEVRQLAEHYFGPVPGHELPLAKAPLELEEPGERRLTLHVRTQLPSLVMGFNVPSLASSTEPRQIHALRLLSALLDGGYSARLSTHLEREQELVTGASAWYDAFSRGDSLFTLSATPNVQKQHSLAEVEAGLWRELDALKQTPPTAGELERVRAQVIAGLVYERDSITRQASSIGRLESAGLSWQLLDQELDALGSVTPEDIQQAARTFFTPARMSVAHVLPLENPAHDPH